MKISHIDMYSYQLPLRIPFLQKEKAIMQRDGWIVRLCNEKGAWGYGDICPLPGFHRERIPEVTLQLSQLKKTLIGRPLSNALIQLNGEFENWLKGDLFFPSVRYGIEMAVLNMFAGIQKKPLAALWSDGYHQTIALNGILNAPKAKIAEQLKQFLENGILALKVKVGRRPLAEEIELIHYLDAILPRDILLRLDANRSWDLKTAIQFTKAISRHRIEYLEEPLRNPAESEGFQKITGCPLALDESLLEVEEPAHFQPPKGTAAFILKPALLGGLEKAMQLARRARQLNLKAVVSSSFESGVGLAALVNLAAALKQKDLPMGLATYQWFKQDLLQAPLTAQQGRLDVAAVHRQSLKLQQSLLTPLPADRPEARP